MFTTDDVDKVLSGVNNVFCHISFSFWPVKVKAAIAVIDFTIVLVTLLSFFDTWYAYSYGYA